MTRAMGSIAPSVLDQRQALVSNGALRDRYRGRHVEWHRSPFGKREFMRGMVR